MKKNSLLKELSLVVAILSILIFAGCTKNPPAPTPVAPVITLSGVVTTPLNYADSTSFSWSVTGKNIIVSLNGKKVSPTGTYSTGRLFTETTYKLSATNGGGTVSQTVAIKVGDWTSSMYGMISHSYWIFGSISEKSDLTHNLWYVFTKDETDPGFYTDSYYFYSNGIFDTKNRYTNDLISSHRWDLAGDVISFEGGDSGIVTQATEDTLTIVGESSFADSTGKEHQAQIRNIYIRDTTK